MSLNDGSRSVRSYAYAGGMLNIAWLSGYARHVKRENGCLSGFVQQNNDITRMLPFRQDDPSRFGVRNARDQEPIKIIGRVRAKMVNGTRHAYIDPIEIGSPSVIEMPSGLSWHQPIKGRDPSKVEQDDFTPFSGNAFGEFRLREAANMVRLAGIVDGVFPLRDGSGGRLVGLEILLRQTADPDEAVPVRVMNGHLAKAFRNELRMGRPVLIHGKFRVRDEHATDENGAVIDTGNRIGYVFCRTVLNARRGQDIVHIPAWVNEILERYGRDAKANQNPEATETDGSEHATVDQVASEHDESVDHHDEGGVGGEPDMGDLDKELDALLGHV